MPTLEEMKRRPQIIEHDRETAVERSTAADYHIIAVRSHGYGIHPLHQFAKPAPDTISLGRGAILLGHREADPDRAVVVAAVILHHESGGIHPRPTGSGEEVRPLPQPVHDDVSKIRSGAQALAASRAPRGKDFATSGGRQTGTKAVTALAHQFAGLISPLHGNLR
jgi:hypothetical protein